MIKIIFLKFLEYLGWNYSINHWSSKNSKSISSEISLGEKSFAHAEFQESIIVIVNHCSSLVKAWISISRLNSDPLVHLLPSNCSWSVVIHLIEPNDCFVQEAGLLGHWILSLTLVVINIWRLHILKIYVLLFLTCFKAFKLVVCFIASIFSTY